MQVQRFSYKTLGEDAAVTVIAHARPSFQPSGKGREKAPPPPPSYSEDDLKIAEREGYKKGFVEGTQDGVKQGESQQALTDRQLSETVEKFAAALPTLFNDYRQIVLHLKQQMPKVAVAVARKVAGAALKDNALAAVEDMTARCCETMMSELKLTITVHDSLADALEKRLQKLAERLPEATSVVIQSDGALPPSDCRIEWNQGSMERNTAQLWEQVEKTIENMTAVAVRDTEEQLKTVQAQLPPEANTTNTVQDKKE